MLWLKLTLLLPPAFLVFSDSYGQQPEVDLDPVTVTSSISETTVSKTGRNIFIIPGDRFNALPVNSVDELLRYVPGVEIQARGPMGAQADIVMRGGTFQQVLVLLDGIRLNDPVTGHFNTYIPIAPSEIERIEVLKGASSAIYGSEAVGGVVHVITKTFAAKKGVKKSSALAQVTGGEYKLRNIQLGGFHSGGTSAVGGGVLSNNSDGQLQRGTRGFFNAHTASLSLSHFVNDRFRVALRSAYDDREFAAQNFYTTFASDTATERVRSLWNHLSFAYQAAKNKVTFDGGMKTGDDHYAFNSGAVPNQNRSRLWQARLQNEYRHNEKLVWISGLQFTNRTIRSNDRGNHAESNFGVFSLLNYYTPFGLTVSPSLRVDQNEERGLEVIPQLSAVYRLSQVQFRGSAGKTIRDADFTERYNNYNKVLVNSGRIGNPDLRAETSFNYELGADVFIRKNFKMAGTFFQRFHKDLIDYVPTPYSSMPRKSNLSPNGTYALARNIATVDITGAELDLQYSQALGTASNLWGSVGAIITDASSSDGASAFYLSSAASFLTNFNLQLSLPRFSISANGLYKQRAAQRADPIKAALSRDYFVLNGKAEVNFLNKKAHLFTQVDNIFDARYSDLLGAQMPGRWLMFGAKFIL